MSQEAKEEALVEAAAARDKMETNACVGPPDVKVAPPLAMPGYRDSMYRREWGEAEDRIMSHELKDKASREAEFRAIMSKAMRYTMPFPGNEAIIEYDKWGKKRQKAIRKQASYRRFQAENRASAGGISPVAFAAGVKPTLVKKTTRIRTKLVVLELAWNRIGSEGAAALGMAFRRVSDTLTSVNLSHNGIGHTGGEVLARSLQGNGSITSLDLTSNALGDAGAESVSRLLTLNSSLKSLYLGGNQLSDLGLVRLCEAMDPKAFILNKHRFHPIKSTPNTSLTELYLPDNSLGYIDDGTDLKASMEGSIAIGKLLVNNRSLRHYDISRNRMEKASWEILCKNIRHVIRVDEECARVEIAREEEEAWRISQGLSATEEEAVDEDDPTTEVVHATATEGVSSIGEAVALKPLAVKFRGNPASMENIYILEGLVHDANSLKERLAKDAVDRKAKAAADEEERLNKKFASMGAPKGEREPMTLGEMVRTRKPRR